MALAAGALFPLGTLPARGAFAANEERTQKNRHAALNPQGSNGDPSGSREAHYVTAATGVPPTHQVKLRR
jgi:hypothetical protein